MNNTVTHRKFKDLLYGQFALIGKALASPARLEMLELLAQGPRTVEALANESNLSIDRPPISSERPSRCGLSRF